MADRVPPRPEPEPAGFGSPIIPEPEHELHPEPESDHPWLPERERETYIVQVPKEQIYRVPPPENAALVERYQNQVETRTSRCPSFLKCLAWSLAAAFVVFLLVGVVGVGFLITVRPASPRFEVDQVNVAKPTSPEYDFVMGVRNPSGRLGFEFEEGKAILSFDGVRIAKGETGELEIDSKNVTRMKVALKGLKMVVPKPVGKALKGGEDSILVRLEMEIRVSGKAWGMEKGGMNMKVSCDVRLKGLVKEAGIKSQKCTTDLRWI